MDTAQRRLLVAFAHPDDESFIIGGTLARYAAEGVGITLICATDGDAGTVAPEHVARYGSVAAVRRAELDCAVEALGIGRVVMFGYRDSGMAGSPDNEHPHSLNSAPLAQVTERIADVIREVQPQVVLTFDPFGGYGHPDHIKMHLATLEACQRVESQPVKPRVFCTTPDRRWLRLMVRLMPLYGKDPKAYGRNRDVNLLDIAAQQFPIHARLSVENYRPAALRAQACHASQIDHAANRDIVNRIRRRLERTHDAYMQVQPIPQPGQKLLNDLFEAVET